MVDQAVTSALQWLLSQGWPGVIIVLLLAALVAERRRADRAEAKVSACAEGLTREVLNGLNENTNALGLVRTVIGLSPPVGPNHRGGGGG